MLTDFVMMGVLCFYWLIVLISPLVALILLTRFRKDDIATYIGAFSLKPMFGLVIYVVGIRSSLCERLDAIYQHEFLWAFLWIVPESIMTLLIAYIFRQLFRKDKTAWLFLTGDIIRWSSLSVEALIPDPFPEPYFYTQLFIQIFFTSVFPVIYAIYGLFIVTRNTNTSSYQIKQYYKNHEILHIPQIHPRRILPSAPHPRIR